MASPESPQPGRSELLWWSQTAREAAAAGAAVLQRHVGQLRSVREKGRPGDLVTEADLAAEQAVLAVLRRSTPDLAILAEESGAQPGSADLLWCVDPLDGTTNYAHGFPLFATSVGLLHQGVPLLGAVSVPALNELYWAAPGCGAWCNDRPITVSGADRLDQALLTTGFAYDRSQHLDTNYAQFCWFTHRSRGVRRGGAAAVDLAFVACGRLDGYWERGLAPWDLAAGAALVREAGGVVSAYDGGPFQIDSGRILACAPGLQQPMIEGLASVQPLPGHSFGAPELDQATGMGS
ncbi:inositol monophosphatase [Synechococcus sp. RSCCF101]|uniref:inositol monophosphatase family protein n=1 Tax=Synechococcus sp. RSCCF101 TaxID=2511069 RepID=UPI0012478A5F|nr:inositol monophosphatase family protein [Synechococcus sp. RSCCF101]QEY31697.1 inositol monophosphatase [Synechococcus sp. RSCCF101]